MVLVVYRGIEKGMQKLLSLKIPIVKEHGSWVVFILSCVAGVITALLNKPWLTKKVSSIEVLLVILGLMFLINSKNPLSSVLKTGLRRKNHMLWFIIFSIIGIILLIPFLKAGLKLFWVFLPLIGTYIILLSAGKEHALITELNGFILLTLAAPIIYFVITNEISFKLYFAVFLFFGSGVFKVRVKIKKTFGYRMMMILYCVFVLLFFLYIGISATPLLPLLENVVFALWLREEKLRTTGNVELIKGVIFTILLGFSWRG